MKNTKHKKNSVQKSVDDLAIITARGFESIGNDMQEVKGELGEVKEELGEVRKELIEINQRLNVVEALLASNRIEHLEDRMRVVLTHLNLKV